MLSAQHRPEHSCGTTEDDKHGGDSDSELASSAATSSATSRAASTRAAQQRSPPSSPRLAKLPARYLVSSAPRSLHYIPAVFNPAESAALLQQIYACKACPPWTSLRSRRAKTIGAVVIGAKDDGENAGRRRGDKQATTRGVIRFPFPPWLEAVVDRVMETGVSWGEQAEADADGQAVRPNSCLVNEYAVGQGIFAHRDGPAFHPVVATVSLGGTGVLELERVAQQDGDAESSHEPPPSLILSPCSVLLEPGSLLVLSGEAYEDWTHSIPAREEDCGPFANVSAALDDDGSGDKDEDGVWHQRRRREATRVSLTFRRVAGEVGRDAAADVLSKIKGKFGRR
ncbi:Alpha-ketoglutarate-dependent dioxygenase alkB 6 [Geranomyces variabilis]|nr:Alpha-ketoglutarate-dependent dioxygenase alkB 6 [Geranomyces variabilis]